MLVGDMPKQSSVAIVGVAVFFCFVELLLAMFGVKPLILTDDPLVGFVGNVPLFVEQRNPDGSMMLRTADNKQFHFN